MGLASMSTEQGVAMEGGEEEEDEEDEWTAPPRMTLTEAEMEMVELGGALP